MDERVKKLINMPQLQQRSPEWYAARPNFITASSAANLLIRDKKTCGTYVKTYGLEDIFDFDKKCCNPYSTKVQYYLDKCIGSKFKGNIATYHGQKYEQVASDIYSNMVNEDVLEFGLIIHEKYPWLAASPDGITPSGVMLEIKCPYRRKINGITPLVYWIQTQLQMEVCDLEKCDFAEFEFIEFSSKEEWEDTVLDIDFLHTGIIIQIEKITDSDIPNPEDNEYIYPPRELINNDFAINEWVETEIDKLNNSIKEQFTDKRKFSRVFWKVKSQYIKTIHRDREWFENTKPVFIKEWNKIEFYKKNDNYKKLLSNEPKIIGEKTVYLDIGDKECILSDSD